ncbi:MULTISPECIES: methyl-accepting chemotaxis protein [unclassified Undibacterium]|uniref:methyl-accepting chemotaxis protein n=1 Tax=unclassified Undibacterium TaxID=2630295 RepID=UPI002AC9EFB6|nr:MULTISPECIES: methyl-accepting chemotaxis protein [unclassified Undibacterium]MEB0138953.1 methyl-accepting chemotaxis protein [Undibacterium sp. CCC2.1]MEB0171716.1 methyl-accepting chemotaxis protein [Undibacterium sp. CCC1.1]MEB0175584.1 methyl-accepting chemotaxis protein [Undibacterium sp. CCC3.4]MEB0214918.1 methyl-accepting chemotaxis protein [Undibacterium sp. 5I2]WPX44903.1 methyl-accepting chemotaxis protein [Undibacterium sp. CCC3.4]
MQNFSFRKHGDLLLALLLLAAGTLTLLSQTLTVLNTVVGLLILLCGIYLVWSLHTARLRENLTEQHSPVHKYDPAPELPNLVHHVLPLWDAHVASVKQQTQTAVEELIGSFASMVNEFDAAGFGGVANLDSSKNSDATITLLQLCKKELAPVVSSFSNMIESKDELLHCIRDLAKSTNELNAMAQEVGQIAAQTNLLAINAAIEAARVGVHGRGFAVVAGEVRKLSHMSAETGRRMTERVKNVAEVMKTALTTADRAAIQDSKVLEVSGAVVRDVLSHVEAMGSAAEDLRAHGNHIRGNIEELLVSLQFQDRTSQLLDVIRQDINKMQANVAFAGDIALPATEQWLADLQSTYTMSDEYRNHGNTDASSANNDSEITFF